MGEVDLLECTLPDLFEAMVANSSLFLLTCLSASIALTLRLLKLLSCVVL